MPGERYFTISDGRVEEGGMGAGLTYDREQLLQAKNEYNKAALSTTTLNEYKKVIRRILSKKLTEHSPRGTRSVWMDLRTI